MEENNILRIVYTFFIGILLAIFVGLGVATFYPGPEEPEYPQTYAYTEDKELTEEQKAAQRQFDQQYREYNEKMEPYSRNVSIITMIAGVVLLAISILWESKIKFISNGVMLGGLFTLIYSVIRGFMSGDEKYTFIAVTVGLAVSLYLGYRRFVVPHQEHEAPKAVVSKSKKKTAKKS